MVVVDVGERPPAEMDKIAGLFCGCAVVDEKAVLDFPRPSENIS